MTFKDFVRWAGTRGDFIQPKELFAFVERVEAGEITPTAWENRLLATLSGVMMTATPSFVLDVIAEAAATMRTEPVKDFIAVQTFLAMVDDLHAKTPETPYQDVATRMLELMQAAALAAEPTKGRPS